MRVLPFLRAEPLIRSFDEVAEGGNVTPYSAIFRPDAQLHDVLGLALKATTSKICLGSFRPAAVLAPRSIQSWELYSTTARDLLQC